MRFADENSTWSSIAIEPRDGRAQAGDGIERGRLSGAGRAEERRDPAGQLLADLEDEPALLDDEVERDHDRALDWLVRRFDSHSEPKAIVADTPTMTAASASRPVSVNV